MPSNTAAWNPTPNSRLAVASAPYSSPITELHRLANAHATWQRRQIVIHNRAIAVNPSENVLQAIGTFVFPWLKYPAISGVDVAGEVVEVGPDSRFSVGDRVVGASLGTEKAVNDPACAAFQQYVVLRDTAVARIPDHVAFEQAAVIPLGFSSAGTALFSPKHLGLSLPTSPPRPSTGQVVIVWGGSGSVGINAIQLAKAAGCTVYSVSSARNFELCRQGGANEVFDYHSPEIIAELRSACMGKVVAGAITLGPGGAEACLSVMRDGKIKGGKVIAMIAYPLPSPLPTTMILPRVLLSFGVWVLWHALRNIGSGIKSDFVQGGGEVWFGDAVPGLWNEYLEDALAAGEFTCLPLPVVVGQGLEYVQVALDRLKEGASAQKFVVRL
ncbi:hypothetical protein IAT40_004205 [Kwoniella sp. CBS 6097]